MLYAICYTKWRVSLSGVCFNFQVHEPYRLKKYRIFDIGTDSNYWNGEGKNLLNNEHVFRLVANQCYFPANRVLGELLANYPKFKISFSFSGVFLDQAVEFCPELIESFRSLITTGRVEIVGETYYHSLAFFKSKKEFCNQVRAHSKRIEQLFEIKPKVFKNTELLYNNDLAKTLEELDFDGSIVAGQVHEPNFVYKAKNSKHKLLVKNNLLSDDISYRFGKNFWSEPLTGERFSTWLNAKNQSSNTINLLIDYKSFGEHNQKLGIFDFLRTFVCEHLQNRENHFLTPSEAIESVPKINEIDLDNLSQWSSFGKNAFTWLLPNSIQQDVLEQLYALESQVLTSQNPKIIEDWRRLQSTDNFYNMSEKSGSANPYGSPQIALVNFMNTLNDLKQRIAESRNSRIFSFPSQNLFIDNNNLKSPFFR